MRAARMRPAARTVRFIPHEPSAWRMGRDDVIGFLRGTRPPAPPGPKRPLATVLLFAAAIVHLPIVYALVAAIELAPPFTIAIGLLSMGLAWSGGVALEGRRPRTMRFIAALGVAEATLAFVPMIALALDGVRWLFLVVGALSAGALLAR